MHKEGEEDHDNNGSSKRVGVGKDQDQSTFTGKEDGLSPDTSSHSHAGTGNIRDESSKTTSKQVHPAEDGGNGSSRLSGLTKFVLEVKGSSIVHGQFNSKTSSILDEKDPSVEVDSTRAERGSCRNFRHISMFLEVRVVTLGGIIREHVKTNSMHEANNSRDDTDSTPCLFRVTIIDNLEEGEQGRSHDQLGDTSTQVSPSTTQGIGSSNNFLGEHSGCPVLAHHKGTSSNTNEETKDGKASGTVDKSSTGSRDGSSTEDKGKEDTGSILVTEGSEEETHEDGSTNTNNGGGPDFLLANTQVITDLREQRSNSEPDEEGNEETRPRVVESTHVGASKRHQLDLSGLIILIRVNFDMVLRVLLPFSLRRTKQ